MNIIDKSYDFVYLSSKEYMNKRFNYKKKTDSNYSLVSN